MSSIPDSGFASVDFTAEDGKAFAGEDCTLNGEKAVITGRNEPFARITQYGSRLGCDWSWPTVARIMTLGDGEFHS